MYRSSMMRWGFPPVKASSASTRYVFDDHSKSCLFFYAIGQCYIQFAYFLPDVKAQILQNGRFVTWQHGY